MLIPIPRESNLVMGSEKPLAGQKQEIPFSSALEKVTPELAETIKRAKEKGDKRLEILGIDPTKEIQKHVTDHGQEQLTLSFMPTEMARTSPFFPMGKHEKAHRELITLAFENPWGRIVFKGPKLSISEEDILLAVVRLYLDRSSLSWTTDQIGNRVLSIKLTGYRLLKEMGLTDSKLNYDRLWNALELLAISSVKIELERTDKKGKRKRIRRTVGPIIAILDQEEETKRWIIGLSPYFQAMFLEGLITYLDLDFRRSLKGDITKALYRFLESQRGESLKYHVLTLAQAINLNLEQPLFTVRKQIKISLSELRKRGYLTSFKTTKNDLVLLKRKPLKSQADTKALP